MGFAIHVLIGLLATATAKLVLLQQISRHGARAPKSGYENDCPKDPWRWQWDSSDAQLTGPGELEEMAIGEVTSKYYGSFLGIYNGSKHYVRAADSDRTLQSATVTMTALFKDGTGPKGGLPNRPVIVPVHTVEDKRDDVLAVEDGDCKKKLKADNKVWWAATGIDILAQSGLAAAPVTNFCGFQAADSKTLKNQVDGVGFDKAEGLLTTELTDSQIFNAQNLSIVLQRGDFATDGAQTYLAGALPSTLLANMKTALAGSKPLTYIAYFAHRHPLYALAEFFGWKWTMKGIPPGMVHTGSTIFVELHEDDTEPGEYFVQFRAWSPHCGQSSYAACESFPIEVEGCGTKCSIDMFEQVISDRVSRTGDYTTLCADL